MNKQHTFLPEEIEEKGLAFTEDIGKVLADLRNEIKAWSSANTAD